MKEDKAQVPTRPNAPKQAIDSPADPAAEQPNPGDPGPPVLKPEESSEEGASSAIPQVPR